MFSAWNDESRLAKISCWNVSVWSDSGRDGGGTRDARECRLNGGLMAPQ